LAFSQTNSEELFKFEPACQYEEWDSYQQGLKEESIEKKTPTTKAVGELHVWIERRGEKTSVSFLRFTGLLLKEPDSSYEFFTAEIIDLLDQEQYKTTVKTWTADRKELFVEGLKSTVFQGNKFSWECWITILTRPGQKEKIYNVSRNPNAYDFELLIKSKTNGTTMMINRMKNISSNWAKTVIRRNPNIEFESETWNPK
jgi:hypothetical protein